MIHSVSKTDFNNHQALGASTLSSDRSSVTGLRSLRTGKFIFFFVTKSLTSVKRSEQGFVSFFLGHGLLGNREAVEPSCWDKFEDDTPNKGEGTNTDANKLTVKVQRSALDKLATILNNEPLSNNFKDSHEEEVPIVAEI